MSGYVCPGCKAHDMAYECWHDENMWKLAEALSIGLPGGPASWGDPVERAWQFIDDAEGLAGSVGAPPYAVSMFHVGGKPTAATTIGLVNGRYLFIVDEEAQLIGDVFDGHGRAQMVMPDLTADVVAEEQEWEYGYELLEADTRDVLARGWPFDTAEEAQERADLRAKEELDPEYPPLIPQIVRRHGAGPWVPIDQEWGA